MTHDGAKRAVVGGIRCRRIELGRLHQRGGKIIGVLLKIEHGGDRVGRDPPFGHIRWLAQPRKHLAIVPFRNTL